MFKYQKIKIKKQQKHVLCTNQDLAVFESTCDDNYCLSGIKSGRTTKSHWNKHISCYSEILKAGIQGFQGFEPKVTTQKQTLTVTKQEALRLKTD